MTASRRAELVLSQLMIGDVVGAEIGVYRGKMSAVLLKRPNLTLYMVDNWKPVAGLEEAGYNAADQLQNHRIALNATAFAGERRIVLHMNSVDAAKKIEDGTMDFVFIDADHTYEGCKADIAAWRSKVKMGGILCGHDYDNKGYGVTQAVDEFVAENKLFLDCGDDHTWWTQPNGLSQYGFKLNNECLLSR